MSRFLEELDIFLRRQQMTKFNFCLDNYFFTPDFAIDEYGNRHVAGCIRDNIGKILGNSVVDAFMRKGVRTGTQAFEAKAETNYRRSGLAVEPAADEHGILDRCIIAVLQNSHATTVILGVENVEICSLWKDDTLTPYSDVGYRYPPPVPVNNVKMGAPVESRCSKHFERGACIAQHERSLLFLFFQLAEDDERADSRRSKANPPSSRRQPLLRCAVLCFAYVRLNFVRKSTDEPRKKHDGCEYEKGQYWNVKPAVVLHFAAPAKIPRLKTLFCRESEKERKR